MHVRNSHRSILSVAVAAFVLTTAVSCSGDLVGPSTGARPALNVTPGPTQSKICKYGPVGTYIFSITSAAPLNGTLLVPNPVTISVVDVNGTCVVVHQSGNGTDNLVIRESPLPAGIVVERIITGAIGDGCQTNGALCAITHTGTDQVTISPNATTGFYASFYNAPGNTPPPPPPAGQGCTPGYWKNHLNSWTGFAPGADFDATFGVNAFSPNITLQQALNLEGGKINQLARHATAALLNSAHPGVAAGASTSNVIAMVQAAVASRNYEPTALVFEGMNEQGCPLN